MADDYTRYLSGDHCEIWLHKSAVDVIRGAQPNHRARAQEIMKRLSNEGPTDLNEKMFKFEGRFGGSNQRVAVYAVKAYQLRILGGWPEGESRKFICPEATIKKTNKADGSQLKRVAGKVGDYCDD